MLMKNSNYETHNTESDDVKEVDMLIDYIESGRDISLNEYKAEWISNKIIETTRYEYLKKINDNIRPHKEHNN